MWLGKNCLEISDGPSKLKSFKKLSFYFQNESEY